MSQSNQNPSSGTQRPTMPPLPPPEPPSNGQHDSVEASLEDFINQANQSLQEPVPVEDPYAVNTGEVELIEDEEVTSAIAASADSEAPVEAVSEGATGVRD